MHVYVWEYIVSLYYRIALWVLMKLGRDEVLIAPHIGVRLMQGVF